MTDIDSDGIPETVMEFHVGTNAMLRTVDLEAHKDLDQDQNTVTFGLDLSKLFIGIDLRTEYSCHTADDPPLAARFADNWEGAFSIK